MARYDSPSVDVQVIDESFYASAGQGTVPLIIVATHKNKPHPSGIGIAEGTLAKNGGSLSLIGSQRELIQYFGNPKFYTDDIGTAVHAYELNEFGLHAAYQYLAVANRVYIINAAIDLNQLQPTRYEPRGLPMAGTFWLDTRNSRFGVHVSDGGSVPGVAWQPRNTRVIDLVSEVETVLMGETSYSGPDATVSGFAGPGHTITINGTVVALPENATLRMAAQAINDANLPNITAVVFRNGGRSYLVLKNIGAGSLDITGTSSPDIISAFGATYRTFYLPKSNIGNVGDFCIFTLATDNVIYQKLLPLNDKALPDTDAVPSWFIVGSAEWKKATPTVALGSNFTGLTAGSKLKINGEIVDLTSRNTVSLIAEAINMAGIADVQADAASATQLRIVNLAGGNLTFANETHTPMAQLGITSVKGNELYYSGHTQYPSGSIAGDVWIKTTEYNSGAKWVVKVFSSVTGKWTLANAPLVGNAIPVGTQSKLQADDAKATAIYGGTPPVGVLYVRYNVQEDGTASHQIRRYNGAGWDELSYEAGSAEPTTTADDGTLWYNEDFRADIMVNLGGSKWVGYRNHPDCALTDAGGPFLQASAPLTQRDGTPLEQNDLWIDTSDLENYPAIYRFQSGTKKWVRVDNTDQTTPFGIVFDDARANSGVHLTPADTYKAYSESVYDLLESDFVDPDCVDPRLYPDGVLLFNLRYSTMNVKEWRSYYFADGGYADTDFATVGYTVGNAAFPSLEEVGRWVTVSGKKIDGSPYMGRKAQRKMIVESMQQAVNENEAARAETVYFNLMAAPGYVELVDEMISLNVDKKETAYILVDTPARLKPTAQAIQNWVTPADGAQVQPSTEDALGTNNPYAAVYYPWGLSSNIDGKDVMVPPSTIALRVMAQNDNVAYPWYAPAGFTRGLVTNATSVGYLTAEGEFKPVILNQSQRDNLYINKINPIAYIPNRGLVVFGQKSLYGMDSALDRVNVGRLINYLRYHADNIAKQFLFEPNVQHTRDVARITFERFLSDLVGLNAIYDFLVVCDDSNNTPARIDRNELWIDIAIQPVKAIEFVVIPIRVRNTGEDLKI
jgi:hypothetical protein